MTNQEIESAVEILQEIIDYDWKNLDQESYKQTLREKIKPLMLLFLEVEKGMPEKKVPYCYEDKENIAQCKGFNSCLDLCTAHLVKKCEGIGNLIQDYFHKSNEVIIDGEGNYCGKVELGDLAQAIKEYLLGSQDERI